MSFTGGGVGRRGRCTTKARFSTHQAASAALTWRVENLGSYRPSYQVVACRHCKGFHIAHKIPKDRKGRRFE